VVHQYKNIHRKGKCLILFTQIWEMYVAYQGQIVCEHKAFGVKSRFYLLQSINAEIDVSLL